MTAIESNNNLLVLQQALKFLGPSDPTDQNMKKFIFLNKKCSKLLHK